MASSGWNKLARIAREDDEQESQREQRKIDALLTSERMLPCVDYITNDIFTILDIALLHHVGPLRRSVAA